MSSYNQDYDFQSGQLGPSTAANLGVTAPQFGDVRRYNKLTIIISGLATETIQVAIGTDALGVGAGAMRPVDVSTGAVTAATTLGNGTYVFDVSGAYLISLAKSATVDNATVRYAFTRYT